MLASSHLIDPWTSIRRPKGPLNSPIECALMPKARLALRSSWTACSISEACSAAAPLSRSLRDPKPPRYHARGFALRSRMHTGEPPSMPPISFCLLYTSDAADDLTRVDLGG